MTTEAQRRASQKWRENNKDKVSESGRKYRIKHPDLVRARRFKRENKIIAGDPEKLEKFREKAKEYAERLKEIEGLAKHG
jgi:hypothetical protein